MDIGIVGPGRLGRSLALLLREKGANVTLAGREDPWPDTPVVLLTVPDRAIADAARHVRPNQVLLHTSGATDLAPLRPHTPAGSFHPIMTFPGPDVSVPNLEGVPAGISGDERAICAARDIAELLGMRAVEVPGDRRLYHAAAVLAGNFATVLFELATASMTRAGVSETDARAMLAPLALRSVKNAAETGIDSLTGPLARGDEEILHAHRQALTEVGLQEIASTYDPIIKALHRMEGFEDRQKGTGDE